MKIKELFVNPDKYEKVLLEVYIEVYKQLGVDFLEQENEADWFMQYEMSHKRQEEIAESVLAKTRLQRWRRDSIMSAYWLGPAPKGVRGEDY